MYNMTRQDNIAYNRRLYDDPKVMSPNRPGGGGGGGLLNGPQNEQRGPEVLCQQNTLIQQVVHFEYDPELRHLVQGNDASIEQIIQEILQIYVTVFLSRRDYNKSPEALFVQTNLLQSRVGIQPTVD